MIFNTTNYPLLPIESTDLFQLEVQTTASTGNLVALPISGAIPGYNFYVNWGDGSAVEHITVHFGSHIYSHIKLIKVFLLFVISKLFSWVKHN